MYSLRIGKAFFSSQTHPVPLKCTLSLSLPLYPSYPHTKCNWCKLGLLWFKPFPVSPTKQNRSLQIKGYAGRLSWQFLRQTRNGANSLYSKLCKISSQSLHGNWHVLLEETKTGISLWLESSFAGTRLVRTALCFPSPPLFLFDASYQGLFPGLLRYVQAVYFWFLAMMNLPSDLPQ